MDTDLYAGFQDSNNNDNAAAKKVASFMPHGGDDRLVEDLKDESDSTKENNDPQMGMEQVEIEYVPEKLQVLGDLEDEFRKVFEKFTFRESAANDKNEETAVDAVSNKKANGISNKKKKLQRRMKIAQLKLISSKPDVVEVWDATSADPKLLVFLKSYRNTVPVPRHWCHKRKFLQGKRGIEKHPFQLPGFIAATGIEKIRQAYIEKEDNKKLKQKQRERMQPKMGKMDIDYQLLHDAFFKYQTKPKLTSHGDLYHEGKEFEVKLREMTPGSLSHELKEALGMTKGAPPPWLINIQRYGPPPSYPHLKIPGLNAPIPLGASFGYHSGGWGKPPVDEFGRPVYGDAFGQQEETPSYEEEPIDKSKHWETPDVIDLRKQQRKEPEKPLYQVLEEKEEKIAPGTLLATTHTYVIGGAPQDKPSAKRVDLLKNQTTDRVDVSLQPEDLELMENVLPAKYEEAREEEKLRSQREDFSDMAAKNEKKRKRKMSEKDSKSKKKDFKF
ncbi:proline-rich spliceosome-associated (PSP) family protein [Artemisia annua]|uniref:Proline-rich spliceosome-associated (PSP) family protein n=1 Tax=Artemisia annua TaxID=35608 RepID=A0A2U1NDH5_ARTAN|nr:proline-rich spliceosome-associated (PSP) family protein [Artemisia annua]